MGDPFAKNIETPFDMGWTVLRPTSVRRPPPRERSVVPLSSDNSTHPPGDQSPNKLTPLIDGLVITEPTRAHLVSGILELTV